MKSTMIAWMFIIMILVSACSQQTPLNENTTDIEPITIRIGVSLTPQELTTYQTTIQSVNDRHPEWNIIVENTPQSGIVEKINTQLSAGDLPDIVRLPGLITQQWIRKSAFLELTSHIENSNLDMDDFYSGPLSQFEYNGILWGIPDTATPDVIFYNKDMFDTAGLDYPSDDWTFEDMREAAILLTLDASGKNPNDPDFDPNTIQQWGWNGGISNLWQRHLVRPFGGDFCENEDCTLMNFTDPATLNAVNWWASLVNQDYAAPYDPYGGSQTGIPGDPFTAGKAAMGFNGFFAVGQLNDMGSINYDVVQPFLGEDVNRYTPLSTNGYLLAATSDQAEAAWQLIMELIEPDFLIETWGTPGHSVPARRSSAGSVINPSHPPDNQNAIVEAMEYGEVYKPFTSSAFEAYGKTSDFFIQAMKGDSELEEVMAEIESIANETLVQDRQP